MNILGVKFSELIDKNATGFYLAKCGRNRWHPQGEGQELRFGSSGYEVIGCLQIRVACYYNGEKISPTNPRRW